MSLYLTGCLIAFVLVLLSVVSTVRKKIPIGSFGVIDVLFWTAMSWFYVVYFIASVCYNYAIRLGMKK